MYIYIYIYIYIYVCMYKYIKVCCKDSVPSACHFNLLEKK